MPIPPQAIVRVDYHLYADGKLVETTDEKLSHAEGLHKDGRVYRPFQFITGVGQIIGGLENDVVAKEGVSDTLHRVEIKPEAAYGIRSADALKIIPMARLNGRKIKLGDEVVVDGLNGVVTRIAGGRFVIDTNHKMAGKTLVYEYTIRQIFTDSRGKVQAIVERALPTASVEWSEDDLILTLDVPQEEIVKPQWQQNKLAIVRQIRTVLAEHEPVIRIVENYEAPPRRTETATAPVPLAGIEAA